MKPLEELYSGPLVEFLDKISTFQSHMLTMLEHSAVVVEMLQHEKANDFVNDFKLRANSAGTDGFEVCPS